MTYVHFHSMEMLCIHVWFILKIFLEFILQLYKIRTNIRQKHMSILCQKKVSLCSVYAKCLGIAYRGTNEKWMVRIVTLHMIYLRHEPRHWCDTYTLAICSSGVLRLYCYLNTFVCRSATCTDRDDTVWALSVSFLAWLKLEKETTAWKLFILEIGSKYDEII